MRRRRRTPLLLALAPALALLFWALELHDGRVPGPQESAAVSEDASGSRTSDASAGVYGIEWRKHLSEEGRPPILLASSDQKRRSEITSSVWVGDVFVRISGNESFPDHQILGTLNPYQDDNGRQLRQAIEGQIRTFYRSHGFARVRLKAVLHDSDPFVVDVKIREGPVLSYAGIEVQGSNLFSPHQVAALYPKPGGPVDWAQIRDANISLRQKYHEKGFADVMISGKGTLDRSSDLLRYRIRVVEGIQYRVGEVSLPPELSSRFPLTSGELFRPSLLDEFLRENGLSEAQLQLEHDPGDGLVEITLVEAGGA